MAQYLAPIEAKPGEGHCNNLKCSISGWKVFSCCAAAIMFAVSICFRTRMNFLSRSLSKQKFTTSDRSWIYDNGNVNNWYKRKLNPKI